MISWHERSREERFLLNPSFCASLLWHAAKGYASSDDGYMSFEESFLVLPFVLHRETRDTLPRSTRTSLAVWIQEHPLAPARIAGRAKALVPFTKESLLFGGTHSFVAIDAGRIVPQLEWQSRVTRVIRHSSDEVRFCLRRAEFIGKWFAGVGSSETVLALLGVRP